MKEHRGYIGIHIEIIIKKALKPEEQRMQDLEGMIDRGMEDELRPSGQRRRKATDGNLKDGSTETRQVGYREEPMCGGQPMNCWQYSSYQISYTYSILRLKMSFP